MGHELAPVVVAPLLGPASSASTHDESASATGKDSLTGFVLACSAEVANLEKQNGKCSSDGDSSSNHSNPVSGKTSPNFDTISPLPRRLVPIEILPAARLHDLLLKEDVIVIDSRSKLLYNSEHIKGSLNIPFHPSHGTTINSVSKMESLLTTHEQHKFRQRDISLAVVVYDQSSTEFTSFSRSGGIARLLQDESTVQALYILEGGFCKFTTLYPDLCARVDGKSKERMKRSLRKKLGKYYGLYMELSGMEGGSSSAGGESSGASKTGMSEVLPFLFLGSHEDARNVEALQKHNVEYVLNMAEEIPVWYPQLFTYHHCMAQDHADERLSNYFEEAFTFIDRARVASSRILVHCHMGRSRAPTMVIAYLMREGYSLNDAYRTVAERRPQICPNRGFSMILSNYEVELMNVRASRRGSDEMYTIESPVLTSHQLETSGARLPPPLKQNSDDGSGSSGR